MRKAGLGRLPGTQPSRGRGGFLPITVWLPSPWWWPRCLGVGEVEKGAIKWRRGRSEVQPLAQALARLPEVKSGRDGFSSSGRRVVVACCFSTGPRTSSAPARSREVLASLREGLALAPEVMAGGEVVPAPHLRLRGRVTPLIPRRERAVRSSGCERGRRPCPWGKEGV